MLKIIKYFGTIKHFKLPDLGEKIKEATIVKWHVKEGDKITEFDPVADVSTDKMFTQIPSSFTGVIHKRYHKEQDQCQVGELFVDIDVDEISSVSNQKNQTTQQSSQAPTPQILSKPTPQRESLLQRISPSAKYLALQNNIDINNVKGTGIYGTITKDDISNYQQQPKKTQQINSISQSQTIKMSDFQKGMQKSMTESNTIPHLYLQEEIDVTSLSLFREELKKQQNITFMTLFIKSFSLALLQFPILNSTYDPSVPFQFITHQDHNISIAMDSPKGLVVPNIKQVQNLSILEVQQQLNKLKKLGDESKLGPNELNNGTICISNIGTIAGTYVGPLILPPQVCIVGIGRVVLQPRFIAGSYQPRKIINTSFGCDHRILDGATIARFQNTWKQYLEQPEQMMVKLK
ncbi:unnamed protein product [Paramecium primaurelia]|uniref:Dihydrolipoamide acetyltransferase component of pyruvate dehydrogenase complex n=1 Tax=Paramecium primaurelia TaxID=5886 RepID=A0A8S1LIQ1_PARPR|nr:unnamed protein product [Paramecium primaurelia]